MMEDWIRKESRIQKKPLITKTRKCESTKEEEVMQKTRSFFVFSEFRAFVVGVSFCTP
jgi:hypothetical protein